MCKIAFDDLDDGDVGFKILVKNSRLHEKPYLFKRSEMDNALWLSPPDRLYLRNNFSSEDYFIHFLNEDNTNSFRDLFPNATYNQPQTADYYFIPWR